MFLFMPFAMTAPYFNKFTISTFPSSINVDVLPFLCSEVYEQPALWAHVESKQPENWITEGKVGGEVMAECELPKEPAEVDLLWLANIPNTEFFRFKDGG